MDNLYSPRRLSIVAVDLSARCHTCLHGNKHCGGTAKPRGRARHTVFDWFILFYVTLITSLAGEYTLIPII